MSKQLQYTRLAYQSAAVQSIADVFADVRFIRPESSELNPVFRPFESSSVLNANIKRIRAGNNVSAEDVSIGATATPALSLDVLMETGPGKTFTFIETMFKLQTDSN